MIKLNAKGQSKDQSTTTLNIVYFVPPKDQKL